MSRRKGRLRKVGVARHPSGQIVRIDRAPDDRKRTSRQPHRRVLPEGERMSEKAESPLGRLHLQGIVTAAQYDAGELYYRIVVAYRSVIDGPRLVVGGAGGGGRSLRCGGECDPNLETCACMKYRAKYDAAYCALAKVGRRPQLVVNRMAAHREEISQHDVAYLKIGLDALALHFALIRRRDYGNAH